MRPGWRSWMLLRGGATAMLTPCPPWTVPAKPVAVSSTPLRRARTAAAIEFELVVLSAVVCAGCSCAVLGTRAAGDGSLHRGSKSGVSAML
ncbi:hypothetical protein Micbo1qcDRAFT_18982 [Microdochium bolleyi]|uniref:Uncharacterized protein n=1 Tax=Microdochium bolleyi TaxID=196109 RepID=A0A136ITG6_9PEZI|nr:hypothetical protein Micbo1qcDRAFT_18982 [Microdochium bolleyi]